LTSICAVLLLAGCEAGLWEHRVDGNWKGQLVAAPGERSAPDAASGGITPSRILMRLEENDGRITGKFAQSSDVIAFDRLEAGGSRSISLHVVSGTRDGTDIQMQFSSDDGLAYEVKATVGADAMSGTYAAWKDSSGRSADAIEKGTFNVERY
jgi:hypothetical protein